jgi:hypothetical protein
MVRPILQSGLAGLNEASNGFDRSAAQVARLAGAPSAAESAATVRISPEARGANATQDSDTTGDLESAVVDTRIAKYAFIANLKVLQTGDEMSKELSKLGQKT